MGILDYIEFWGAVVFLILVAGVVIFAVVSSVKSKIIIDSAQKDMVKMLESLPDFDPDTSEEVMMITQGEVYAIEPFDSPITGKSLVYSERKISVYISDERNGEHLHNQIITSDDTECYISVNGDSISLDLSNPVFLFEVDEPRYSSKKTTQHGLTPMERNTLKHDDVLNQIDSLPNSRYNRNFSYRLEELSVEDHEHITVSGIYDPVKNRISGCGESGVILIRNWKMNEKNNLNDLTNFNY